MNVIVTGGGTGGHIYPAVAIAKGLQGRVDNVRILYVGTREGMESRLVPEQGLKFKGIAGRGLTRKIGLGTVKTAGSNIKALWEAKQILKEFRPDLVIGTGGYVSAPVVFTAALFGIPTLLHEQNVLPGKTNKVLSRLVKKVLLAFPESREHFSTPNKIEVVGLPVREEIGKISRKAGAEKFNLNPRKKTILVTGGSRGALSINKAMIQILTKLETHPEIQVIWSAGTATYRDVVKELGTEKISDLKKGWLLLEYIKDMPEALACSDLCICRAGAVTLAELSAAGKPGVLIPYPFASENHQEFNARVMAGRGAAKVILDHDLNGMTLWEEIQKILFSPVILEQMSARAQEVFEPGSLDKIIKICLETAWS